MKNFTLLSTMILSLSFCSCHDGNDSDNPIDKSPTSTESKLLDTSWKLTEFKRIQNGKTTYYETDDAGILTLSQEIHGTANNTGYINKYSIFIDKTKVGTWQANNDEIMFTFTCNAAQAGGYTTKFGFHSDIESLTSNTMRLKFIMDDYGQSWEEERTFSRVYDYSINNGSGTNQGSHVTPEVYFENYDLTKTSITVKFRIANKEESEVESASIYYGLSSSKCNSKLSTSVNGVYVTATARNLKSDTKYYFKCTVKGKGGTGTSDTIPLETL